MVKIVIPTCKDISQVESQVEEIKRFVHVPVMVFSTPNSAAYNRNYAISKIDEGEIVVMMDDDVTGFTEDWLERLVEPFVRIENTVLVSARLMRPNGKLGLMVGENYILDTEFVIVEQRRLPTTCIAFRKDSDIKFDENYVGSGYEDDDFCRQLANKYPKGKFVINNNVKVIHLNEMKNQKGEFWIKNKTYYLNKWPDEPNRWD